MEVKYSATDIAKELGWSTQKLNKLLEKAGVQYPYTYNKRKYWRICSKYEDRNYVTYSKGYVEGKDITRIKMQPVMYWTEQGREAVLKFANTCEQWENYFATVPTAGLHVYTNRMGRQVVQLIRYNQEEPLDGTRAYITEDTRKAFVEDAKKSLYHSRKKFWSPFVPSCAIDIRDPQLFEKWANWVKRYSQMNVLLCGD